MESPAIEAGVKAIGAPASSVGVVIAALASIGLTIPVIAIASVWLDGPLVLGLEPTQVVLLAITLLVATLTVVPGRATRLQGTVHLVLVAAFVFLAVNP